MEDIKQDLNEITYANYLKFEHNITKTGWVVPAFLILEDLFARRILLNQPVVISVLIIQGLLFCLFIGLSIFKTWQAKCLDKENKEVLFELIKLFEIIIFAVLASTMYHGAFFHFAALLPVAFITLTRGFKKTIPYIVLSFTAQVLSQYVMLTRLAKSGTQTLISNFAYLVVITVVQYFLFALFCFIWSGIYNEYARGRAEKNILIDRLGDKYVQLNQAKKEIQSHYDKLIETNNQLEEANRKLTASLAELFTLQQISQAITSIFDMNELLKFVNDVIIGVMGVSHSTIALCYGPQNKLKVQVSSIVDKKDLAIVSDYINCDILKPSTEEGRSMIDNDVNEKDYPFTKGRNIKAMICVPLLAKGKTLGIVLIEHKMKDAFDYENMRLLEVISQQISIAIENARLYQQMHDLATLDGLTGAYNRLYFNDKLQEEFNKAQEGGHDLSFLIFDIDHFKKFNDTYGHLFGDQVLKTLSGYIKKTLRKEDIFARYGGEEFVILMPYTPLEKAREKAEDLRIGASQLVVTDRVISASITISVGVSTYPVTAGSPQELISTADDALYEAKRSGRNLVRVAKPKNMPENKEDI
ncbi:MAG: sensor domain-containing diguanylate cyclase [Clostridiaceae bacterium]|nr:sensor domain-containing diguanylate cyclase [Clostridiaceae bacterium]